MFDHIRTQIEELQRAYQEDPERVGDAHQTLVSSALTLAVESSRQAVKEPSLVGRWSDVGSEGAAGLLKAVELAQRFDSNAEQVSDLERTFLLLLSAVEYYRCGRHGVAAAILDRPSATIPSPSVEEPVLMLASLLTPLCRSEFDVCWQAARRTRDTIGRNLNEESSGADEDPRILELLSVASVANSLLCLKEHLQEGEPESLEDGMTWATRAVDLASASADSEMILLSEAFERAFSSLKLLSLWSLSDVLDLDAATRPVARNWIRHRIDNGKPFLFPTQYAALIGEKVLSDDSALASMPTGGGKSLLAEVFTVKQLTHHPGEKLILIVPSRALAAEKRDELQEAFSWRECPIDICQLTGDVSFDSEEAVREHDVIIATPEKFDILLREGFFDTTVSGLIVDEFHTIRQNYRGLKLQLAIARFRRVVGASTLFISAIVRENDFGALAQWTQSPQPFTSDWKPTPSRIGLVALDSHPWFVKFNDGTQKEIPVQGTVHRDWTRKASVQIVSAFLEQDQVLHFNLYWRAYRGGNALLDLADEYMENLPPMPYLNDDLRTELTRRLARLVGDQHRIVKAFQKGIAVHWGELPHAGRKIMERAARKKAVGLVLATSTLAAGVNLPLKTVYMPKLSTSHGNIDVGLFLNVIGRAGRPFRHPEGQVIVASCEAGRDSVRIPRERAEFYANASSEDVEKIRSAAVATASRLSRIRESGLWDPEMYHLREDWRDLIGPDEDAMEEKALNLLAELENLESGLLAALVEDLIDGIVGSSRLEEVIFIGPETDSERGEVFRLLEVIEGRLRKYGAIEEGQGDLSVTSWGEVVYKTGFGPESCQRLHRRLAKFWHDFASDSFNVNAPLDRGHNQEMITNLLKLIKLPREAVRMLSEQIDSGDLYALRGWIGGVLTRQIAEDVWKLDGDFLKAYTRLEGLLSTFAAWVLYAAHLIAQYEYDAPERAEDISDLAKSVWYGHHDGRVKELLRRDVNRRLLRDDVLVLYQALGPDAFELLLAGDFPLDDIYRVLRDADEVTRLPEDEVAEIVEELTGPLS